MVRNCAVLFFFVAVAFPNQILAQEIKIFKVEDFDLKGKVKSCTVITNYGKEEYDFNTEGQLSKSVTRYSDTDYDITYYKYANTMLLEKRLENYRDNTFDKTTSIANFYTIDSAANLNIIEKIVTYDKVFLEQYEYRYDANKRLVKMIRTNNEGIDETDIEYTNTATEHTKTYALNGLLKESIYSVTKEKDSVIEKRVLTKKYLDGAPSHGTELVYSGAHKSSEISLLYNKTTKEFESNKTVSYAYDDEGVLAQTDTEVGGEMMTKSYIYQFDEFGNWIKEIITPENTYTTRKITYYSKTEE